MKQTTERKPALRLSTYKPNFNDRRVKKSALRVLDWANDLRIQKRPKTMHHLEVQKVFGNYRRPGLARYLFLVLLRSSGMYVPGKQSLTYHVDEEGFARLSAQVGLPVRSEIEVAKEIYGPYLSGDKEIEYTTRSFRRWHPIQNLKKDTLRPAVYDGWKDYDINAAALTLVAQYALMEISERYPRLMPFIDFPTIREVTEDRHAARANIARLTGVNDDKAKELLSALTFLANPAPHYKASLFRLTGENPRRHRQFLDDLFISRLRKELREMWRWAELRHLRLNKQSTFAEADVTPRRRRPRIRQLIYQRIESQVLDAMIEFLNAKGARRVLMHDGFMANVDLDAVELEEWVLSRTGYKVKITRREMRKPQDAASEVPNVSEPENAEKLK